MKRVRAISLLAKKRAEHFLHSSLNHGESLTCSLYVLLLHLYNAIWKAMEKAKTLSSSILTYRKTQKESPHCQ